MLNNTTQYIIHRTEYNRLTRLVHYTMYGTSTSTNQRREAAGFRVHVSAHPFQALPHLHSGLRKAKPLAELFPHEGVRVVRLVEQPLQLVELLQGEVGAAPPLFEFALGVLVLRLHVFLLLFTLVYPCVQMVVRI